MNPSVVQQTVATAVGGQVASELDDGERRFDIVVRLPEQMRVDPTALEDLPIPLGGNINDDESSRDPAWSDDTPQTIPLREVATIEKILGPNKLNRENGKQRVVGTAKLRESDAGSVVAQLKTRGEKRGH